MVDAIGRVLLGVAAVALSAGEAAAQIIPQARGLGDGDRVRITAPSRSPTPTIGHFIEQRRDTIVVRNRASGTSVAFPLASIERIERSQGARQCSGIVPGLIGGAVLGTVVYLTETEGFGPLLALPAALVGYAVTSFVAKRRTCERWTAMPVPTG